MIESETLINKSNTPKSQKNKSKNKELVFSHNLEPISLHVSHLSIRVKVPPKLTSSNSTPSTTKTLLNDVSFSVQPGQLMAILGSSGSGKTTLLNAIQTPKNSSFSSSSFLSFSNSNLSEESGRTGFVYFNNMISTRRLIKENTGYVLQDDFLLPFLTVQETLYYVACLKLPSSFSDQEKLNRVNEVLSELRLRKVKDSMIGSGMNRGISGGERRRVSIAIELLLNPSILLLDEPTTGLDSFNAHNVMQTLQRLSKSQRTVICTIHQPRSDIFKLLDQLMILTNGHLMFCGSPNQLLSHYESMGYPCPQYMNPLDYFVDISSVDRRTQEREDRTNERVIKFTNTFKNSEIYQQQLLVIDSSIHHKPTSSTSLLENHSSNSKLPLPSSSSSSSSLSLSKSKSKTKQKTATNFISSIQRTMREIYIICFRSLKNLFRDSNGLYLRGFQGISFSILVFIFCLPFKDNQTSVQNRSGVMYEVVTAPGFIAMLNEMALFVVHRDLYYRESKQGLYGTGSFLMGYSLHCIPTSIIEVLLFATSLYWPIHFSYNFEKYLVFTFLVWISCFIGQSIGMIFLSIIKDSTLANSMAALVLSAAFVTGSGFLRTLDNLPQILQDIAQGIPARYQSSMMTYNEFKDLVFTCDPGEYCTYSTGDDYINSIFPDAEEEYNQNMLIFISLCVLFRILVYFFFKVFKKPIIS